MEATLRLTLFDRAAQDASLDRRRPCDRQRGATRSSKAPRRCARGPTSIAADVEPELALAVDAMFPMPLLMQSLNAVRGEFPELPATLFTEGLGGAEQRLRDGAARLAIYSLPAGPPPDLSAEFLTRIALIPVVASGHPLAGIEGPLSHETLAAHVQLVLTDRTDITRNIQAGVIGKHIWRFADLSTRLEFLLAGFGWCNMPLHMVADPIAAGRLNPLVVAGAQSVELPIFVVHERGRKLGRAGRWFIDDLRVRLRSCPGAAARAEGPPGVGLVA